MQRVITKHKVLMTQDRAHLLSDRSIMRERRGAWRSRIMTGETEGEERKDVSGNLMTAGGAAAQ